MMSNSRCNPDDGQKKKKITGYSIQRRKGLPTFLHFLIIKYSTFLRYLDFKSSDLHFKTTQQIPTKEDDVVVVTHQHFL